MTTCTMGLPRPCASSRGMTEPRRIESQNVFGKDRVVIILHEGEQYQLRLTRANRLILTK